MDLRAILEELRDFDTTIVANTIGYIDSTPEHEYYMGGLIQSVTPTLGPTVGVAVTCEMDLGTPGGKPEMEGYWRQLEQMQKMKIPVVWVVKSVGSRPDHECIIGEGMAKILYATGCIGLVTDGGVRDVNGLLTTPFAAYCRGRVIHHCVLRIRSINKPVDVGGITIHPGDVIHANQEGVIKIPKECLSHLAENVVKMRAVEHEVHKVWRRTDIRLSEKAKYAAKIFAKYGFAVTTTGRGHELEQ